jgi:hypothetical protein
MSSNRTSDLHQLTARVQSLADEVTTLQGNYTQLLGLVDGRTNILNNLLNALEQGNILQCITQLEQAREQTHAQRERHLARRT